MKLPEKLNTVVLPKVALINLPLSQAISSIAQLSELFDLGKSSRQGVNLVCLYKISRSDPSVSLEAKKIKCSSRCSDRADCCSCFRAPKRKTSAWPVRRRAYQQINGEVRNWRTASLLCSLPRRTIPSSTRSDRTAVSPWIGKGSAQRSTERHSM